MQVIPIIGFEVILTLFQILYTSSDITESNVKPKDDNDIKDMVEHLKEALQKRKRIHTDEIEMVLENADSDVLKSNYGPILLQCCGKLLVDQNQKERHSLCEQVWNKYKQLDIINVEFYNAYLQACIENKIYIDHKQFIKEMKCQPDEYTYKLLLQSVCEFGDVQKGFEILTTIKEKQFLIDEQVFSSLVLGHSIKGGLQAAQSILKMTSAADIPISQKITNKVIQGLVVHNNKDEFLLALKQFPGVIEDKDLIQLMMILAELDHHSWIDSAGNTIGSIEHSMNEFQLMCISLIHMEKPDIAMEYYKKFVKPTNVTEEEGYAFFLLVEMVRSDISSSKIIQITNDLKKEGLNLTALEKITFFALQAKLHNLGWEFLMKIDNLRPHYFWPFIRHWGKEQGEVGVFRILKKMIEKDVRPDSDTLEFYSLYSCDTSNPQQLTSRLQVLGLTVREILTPLLGFLLKRSKTIEAANLCKLYNVHISSEHLLKPLSQAWIATKDTENCVKILKRVSKASNNFPSQFLIKVFTIWNSSEAYEQCLHLVKAMKKEGLSISLTAAETLTNRVNNYKSSDKMEEIKVLIDKLSNASIESYNTTHPKFMNVIELESHLIELKNKQMETRGIIRRLINEYCKLGKYKWVLQLRSELLDEKYEESPGMQTGILHAFVMEGNIEEALKMYESLKKSHSNFKIDEFKIIDLATVLVKNNKFDDAIKILSNEAKTRKISNGRHTLRNCFELIEAGNNEEEIRKLLEVLLKYRYCVASNVVLSPLITFYLKGNNIEKAALTFNKCVEIYNCTPVQAQLVNALVKNKSLELLQKVLNVTCKLKGFESTIAACISAFAQNNLHKPLRKFLLDTPIDHKQLELLCEGWVHKNSIDSLKTLAEVCITLPPNTIDKNVLYYSIMKLYSINNDCESAVSFYRSLLNKEKAISREVVNELLHLVRRCKYVLPDNLSFQSN
ncbi:hypothetical protein FQA39_LY01648 [Lamprigera yunnana]|nr:hypothetical protein FQA39_LY01648 [Lamprigera yunnana]